MSTSRPDISADILVVDDMPANLRLLSETLAERGYSIRTVTSGPRALESAFADPPHLILLDIRMPGMDGFEVCHRLKADERTQNIPIIFISALDDLQDKVQAFQAGGVDYITKPFQVEEVLARTETHLALRQLQLQLQDAYNRMQQELLMAGKLQASFLPHKAPNLAGWQFAATLKSARETSGDFYDFINLPNGKLGVLIADVVDKGVPAALLMAMSWGLLRIYASQHPDSPEAVFAAVNHSLITQMGGDQFLTTFYGILDTDNGRLWYANAGQLPPLYIKSGKGSVQKLALTGPPLGVIEEGRWDCVEVDLSPGSALILYTDGITDAQGKGEEPYGVKRMLDIVKSQMGRNAKAIRDGVLSDIERFVADVPQFDDITLLVVFREHGSHTA